MEIKTMWRARILLLLLLGSSSIVAAESPAKPTAMSNQRLRESTDAWHAKRIEALRAPEGWLTLVGLHWLEDGEYSCGSAPGLPVRIISADIPERFGRLERVGDRVTFEPAPGVEVIDDAKGVAVEGKTTLQSDIKGAPTILRHGAVRLHLIERAGRLGVRVKDSAAPTRLKFKDIDRFPVDTRWVVEARMTPHDKPVEIAVPTAIGDVNMQPSPGRVEFEIDGQTLTLDPVAEVGDKDLFFVFSDATSGTETYGAGRFLVATLRADHTLTLDFNRAYNPPCAFTPYATCPRPPKQNRLAVPVFAGEKEYQE